MMMIKNNLKKKKESVKMKTRILEIIMKRVNKNL